MRQPDFFWSKEQIARRLVALQEERRNAGGAAAAQLGGAPLTYIKAKKKKNKDLEALLVRCEEAMPIPLADIVNMIKPSTDEFAVSLVSKMRRVIYGEGWRKLTGYRSLQKGVPRNPKSFVHMLKLAGELSGVVEVGAELPTGAVELKGCADYLRMLLFTEDAVADDRSYFAQSDPAQVERWLSDPGAAVAEAATGPWEDIVAIEQTVAMDHDRTYRIKLFIKLAAKFGADQIARMKDAGGIPADGSFDKYVRGEDFKNIMREPSKVFPAAETSPLVHMIAVLIAWAMRFDTLQTRVHTPETEPLPRDDPASWAEELNFLTVPWLQCVLNVFEGDQTQRDPVTAFWTGPPTIHSMDAGVHQGEDVAGIFDDDDDEGGEVTAEQRAAERARAADAAEAAKELRELTAALGLGQSKHDEELRLLHNQKPGSGKCRNVPLPPTRLGETKSNSEQHSINIQWSINDAYIRDCGFENCFVGDGAIAAAFLCELRDNCQERLGERGACRSLIGVKWQSQELAMGVLHCVVFTGCVGDEDAGWMRSIVVRTEVIGNRPVVMIEDLTADTDVTCHLTQVDATDWQLFIESGHCDWLMSRKNKTIVNTRSGASGCACSHRSHGGCSCQWDTPTARPDPGEQGIRAPVAGSAWKLSQVARDLICAAIETMFTNAARGVRDADLRVSAMQGVKPEAVLLRVSVSHKEAWLQKALGPTAVRCSRVRDAMVKWLQTRTGNTSRVLGELQSLLAGLELDDGGEFFNGEKVKARFVGDLRDVRSNRKGTGTVGTKKQNRYQGWYRATVVHRATSEVEREFRKLLKKTEMLYKLQYETGGECECVNGKFIEALDGDHPIEEESDDDSADENGDESAEESESASSDRPMLVVKEYQLGRARQPEFNTIIRIDSGGKITSAVAAKLYANDPIVVATLHGVEFVIATMLRALNVETNSMHMAALTRRPFLAAQNFDRAIHEMSDYRGEGAVTGVVNFIRSKKNRKNAQVMKQYGLDWVSRQRKEMTDAHRRKVFEEDSARPRRRRRAPRTGPSAPPANDEDSSGTSSDDDSDGVCAGKRDHSSMVDDDDDSSSEAMSDSGDLDSDGFECAGSDDEAAGAPLARNCADGKHCLLLGVPFEPRHKCKVCQKALHGPCGTHPDQDARGNIDDTVFLCKLCAR